MSTIPAKSPLLCVEVNRVNPFIDFDLSCHPREQRNHPHSLRSCTEMSKTKPLSSKIPEKTVHLTSRTSHRVVLCSLYNYVHFPDFLISITVLQAINQEGLRLSVASHHCLLLVTSSCVKIIDKLLHINDHIFFAKGYNNIKASSGHALS